MLQCALISAILLATVAHGAQLLQIQAIWRHGDRPPNDVYPTDPHKENAWPVKFGELTPRGMWQHFQQGRKLKREYSDKLKFISAKYDPDQIYVRSTDVHRTLASAYSNLAGFYSDSRGTHPNKHRWPTHWTPIPVHTIPETLDLNFIKMLENKTQSNITNVQDLHHLWNILHCENVNGLAFPSWITPDVWKQIIKLGLRDSGKRGDADYASTVVLELWKLDQEKPHVRIRFSANAETSFVTITDKVSGCPKSAFCPLDSFIQNRAKYVLTNYDQACIAKTN
ncbi:hypothetical protein L596_013172 [Steinernema carpocapsae]|uniref:acid phosphatase n=1 Tax=Steinernema carpocapsae TaxID=34508 RepID=A0A4U5NZE2_STECR|nr:hypothetical protein L596_013172 [Steinernema carpocapsae]